MLIFLTNWSSTTHNWTAVLATQGIRGGANRDVLKRIKDSGDIFFAVSDRDWILAGANVHVSMVGFDNGTEATRTLDGKPIAEIHANLAATGADITTAQALAGNFDTPFMGDTKGGAFDIGETEALAMLREPNPHGRPNSDVILPWVNGLDVTRRPRRMCIIDFGFRATEAECAKYATPFAHVRDRVRPERLGNARALYARNWWRHVEPRPGMLAVLAPLPLFLVTARVTKHRLFAWLESPTLPDSALFAFALPDDYSFGVLHSRLHEVWSLAQGTQLREKESGTRYTPSSCFETFPFPFPLRESPPARSQDWPLQVDSVQGEVGSARSAFVVEEEAASHGPPAVSRAAIAAAAKELNELRERWLNPPEWTVTRTLEFPGTVNGPWSRYIDPEAADTNAGIGRVLYPRLEPRDAACAAKLKTRTLTKLYNERPTWLDLAHQQLDAAVSAAYGWPADLPDEQILEKLLSLNLARAIEERNAATTVARTTGPKKRQREKTPEEII
jgi:hypothetical protein